MEGDVKIVPNSVAVENFNPLPPHGGRLFFRFYDDTIPHISIHSLRMEGDIATTEHTKQLCHFNPLPPHGGRRDLVLFAPLYISFQSTPSAWRETGKRCTSSTIIFYFNPLPPHGGRRCCRSDSLEQADFNPLPPHGGRRLNRRLSLFSRRFQSTPSAWRETLAF